MKNVFENEKIHFEMKRDLRMIVFNYSHYYQLTH